MMLFIYFTSLDWLGLVGFSGLVQPSGLAALGRLQAGGWLGWTESSPRTLILPADQPGLVQIVVAAFQDSKQNMLGF